MQVEGFASDPTARPAGRRVALVCMPFFDPRMPSVALGTLAEALRRNGCQVDVFHFHLEAAAAFGLGDYFNLSAADGWYRQMGEWLFSDPSITPGAASFEEYRDFLHATAGEDGRDDTFGHNLIAYDARKIFESAPYAHVRRLIRRLLDRWIRRIHWHQYDVVGFNASFQQLNPSLRLGLEIKQRHPRVRIVLGGPLCQQPAATALLGRYDRIDALFSGYADATLPAYVEDLPSGQQAVVHRGPGVAMDELPIPTYDEYFATLRSTGLHRTVQPQVPMETSRGCWWGEKHRCTFCGFPADTLAFQQKSAERVYDELLSLKRYGQPLYVVDSIMPMTNFKDLLPRLDGEGIKFPSFWYTRSNLTRSQLELCARVGIRWLEPGIESFSTPTLKNMKKGVTGTRNLWFLRASEELEIYPFWGYLFGFPGEDPNEYAKVDELVPLLAHLPPPGGIHPLFMGRHSPLHDEHEALGFRSVRRAEAFRMAFGDHPGLEDQAMWFDYDYPEGQEPAAYTRALQQSVGTWMRLKSLPLAPRCELVRAAGRRLVFDSRRQDRVGRALPRLSLLDDREYELLELLESPLSRARLERAWQGSPATLFPVLDRLLHRGLVVEWEGRLLRLLVMRQNASLTHEAVRVLREKLRDLKTRLVGGRRVYSM